MAGLSFSSPTYSANENDGRAVITVLRSNYANGSVAVNFSTADGTGRAGVNYFPTNGTLVFGSGETAKTFSVPLIDDGALDGSHTVLLNLSNPVGNAVIVNPAAATLTITETDRCFRLTGCLTNGACSLQVGAPPGAVCVLQASTNLAAWIDIATNTVPQGAFIRYTDSDSPSFGTRFYRAFWVAP